MESCRYSYTRERTSLLMRFYNHFSGQVVTEIFVFSSHFQTYSGFLTFFFYTLNYSSSEGRPFRLGTGANMEKVVKMDRDMTKVQIF